MSMATPFEPEHPSRDERPDVPRDDLLIDAGTADGASQGDAAADDVVPQDDRLAGGDEPADDADDLDAALDSEGPKGLRTPQPGDGLTAAELRRDLGA